MVNAAPAPAPAPPIPSLSRRWNWQSWIFPGVLALLVGLFAAITPVLLMSHQGLWAATLVNYGLVSPVMDLANLSVVVAVALSRRSTKLACVLAGWPFLLTALVGTFVWAWWLALLAIAVVAAHDSVRRALLPFGLAVAVVGVYCATGIPALLPIGPVTAGYDDTWIAFIAYLVASLAAVSISAATGASQRARLRTAAAALASEQAFTVEAVASERARIAHDLHDVVAHHISLVAVRAESAPYMHPSMDTESQAVLADIADDARHALGELRQVLAVLQRTEGAERAPQPGAQDVVTLVDAARSAGQEVTVVGDVPDLPSTQGLVLYRAVQESLTNARRHAPGQPVTLTFGTGATASGLDPVAEPGRATPLVVTARLSNPLVPRTSPAAPGRGLLGMRERVESIGGSLTAGEEDGAFVVELTLPLGEPEPEPGTEQAASALHAHTGDMPSVLLLDAPDGTDA